MIQGCLAEQEGRAVTEKNSIVWTTAESCLGPILLAATKTGICRLSFDEGPDALALRYPGAAVAEDRRELAPLLREVLQAIEQPQRPHQLPLHLVGTPFQQAVWAALCAIPPGRTLSYSELGAAAGHPGASRAAGAACGANKVAVLIPCHRARRGDGSPGGYAYGLHRKAALLAREAAQRSLAL